MNLNHYIINKNTLLIVPYGKRVSKVYEYNCQFIVNKTSLNIIKESCLFYGCSYSGRKESSNYLLDIEMKTPIMIDDKLDIIFFPTSSCVREDSIWVSYQNLIKYTSYNDISSTLLFYNNIKVNIGCKYHIIDNQYIKCIKLEKLISKHNEFVEKNRVIFSNFIEN